MGASRDAAAESIAVELFRTTEGRADPYPRYHRLRELAPVHRSETANAWLLTRYEDCWSGLRDPRLGKDYAQRLDISKPWWRERPSFSRFEYSMLNVDGPYHTRLRRLVSKAFTFRSVEAMRPAIESMVDELLEPLAGAGGGDLIGELTFPLPVTVIGELLGVPAQDRQVFKKLTTDLTVVFEVGISAEQLDAADKATNIIDAYFLDLIAERRARPGDDMLSRLLKMPEDDRLTDDELVRLASLLFLAGFETTTNLIGNGMLGLLKSPDQIQLLRERPELFANLADELLRYDGTAQMVSRQSKEEYPVGDVVIPPGETVLLMIAAGNHDPSRYLDPDAVDVQREDIRPLSLGGGVHFCLGAALARAEVEIVFRKIFDRFGTVELDGDPPPFKDRLTLRGLPALPLRLRTEVGLPYPLPAAQREPVPAASLMKREENVMKNGKLAPRPRGASDNEWRTRFREGQEPTGGGKSNEEVIQTVALLGRLPLFAGCTPTELQKLAATAYPIAFDPGDKLCVAGADSPECYIVSEGEAEVTVGNIQVSVVRADDIVGERGPITGRPRAATVTANTHMVTYAISREELESLIEHSPVAATTMRDELLRRYG